MDNKPRTYKKIFQTSPEKKAELLELLRHNPSDEAIAKHFQVDHSSIRWHRVRLAPETLTSKWRKAHKPPPLPKPVKPPKPPKVKTPSSMWNTIAPDTYLEGGEVHRTGKPYRLYLKAEADRKKKEERRIFEELSRLWAIHTLIDFNEKKEHT